MAYSNPEIRTFQGLFLQQNSFQVPDGAMEEALNIVIKSDDVITKTNGFYKFWEQSPLEYTEYGTPVATVLFSGLQMLFCSNGVGRFSVNYTGGNFNPEGTFLPNDAMGTTYSRVESFEQNGNLYVTSDQGIRRFETPQGSASRAGVPPGLSLTITDLDFDNSGVLRAGDAGSQTAYRVLFGRRDFHGNVLLGAPSDILTVGIPAKKVLVPFTITGGIVNFDYPRDPYQISAVTSFEIRDSTIAALNGLQEYFPGDPDKLSFQTSEPNGSGTFSVLMRGARPRILFNIPSELEGPSYEYFYQIYRTSPSLSVDSSPEPDFALISEQTLRPVQYGDRYITFTDMIDERLKGALLYSNPNTREGELEVNHRPPLAKFASFYKNYGMYGHIRTVQRMQLNLANPEELIGRDIIFQVEDENSPFPITEVYRAVNPSVYGPGNVRITQPVIMGTNPLRIGIATTSTFPVGSKVLISNVINGTIVPGEYTMTAFDSGSGEATIDASGYAAFIDVQFVSDGTARLFNGFESTYNTNGDVGFKTVSQWTAYVAEELVKAINLNQSSFMYANYASGFDEFPGRISIESKKFINPIYVRYSSEPDVPPFIQNIPSSFSDGIQFYSSNDVKKHWVCPSKFGEPEAVPVLHSIPVGSSSAEICGQAATRDSFIVVKEDGVYRIRGDSYETMIVEPIDLTVKFQKGVKSILGTINNTIIALSNQGVVQITDTSVQLISRRIEDVIRPLNGRDLSRSFLFGHEADRLFYVATENINLGGSRKCWVYNVLNQSWTEIDRVFDHMSLDSEGALTGILIDSNAQVWKQRRTNTNVDWCGEWATGKIFTDSAIFPEKDKGVFTYLYGNDVIPEPGDVILSSNVFNRIIDVTESLGLYTITFAQPVSFKTDEEVICTLYKGYRSRIKFSPFHAGLVGRMKHFAQMQIHLRQQVITDLKLDFSGAYFNGSNSADWVAQNLATIGAQGWGFSPWGQFPWGLRSGASLKAGTEAAAIIRTYVPRFAARNTFIQPRLTHEQAGQPMHIQALSWSIHAAGERVTK